MLLFYYYYYSAAAMGENRAMIINYVRKTSLKDCMKFVRESVNWDPVPGGQPLSLWSRVPLRDLGTPLYREKCKQTSG